MIRLGGAVVDGPLFGRNWIAEHERFNIAVLPTFKPAPGPEAIPVEPATFATVTYRWRGPVEAYANGYWALDRYA